jgi:hypothetical protein
VLAAGLIRDNPQAHLALAGEGEQPPSSTPTPLPVWTRSTTLARLLLRRQGEDGDCRTQPARSSEAVAALDRASTSMRRPAGARRCIGALNASARIDAGWRSVSMKRLAPLAAGRATPKGTTRSRRSRAKRRRRVASRFGAVDRPLGPARGRDQRLVRPRRDHVWRLRVASSSAARSRMRSSSVMACQRVPRRWPVRRIRPAVSKSRSSPSTWSRFAPACSASAEVVSPPLLDSSDSSRSALMTFDVGWVLGRDVFPARLRGRDAGWETTCADALRVDCVEALVRELARGGELRRLVTAAGWGRDGRSSRPSSAIRAASNVLISSFSSRSRLFIDSAISWVVRILLMLRTWAAPVSRLMFGGVSARDWYFGREPEPATVVRGSRSMRGR